MALDNRYIPDISLSEFLIDPETGLPITGGTVEFWEDEDRSSPKDAYQLTGSPPNYTYDVLPNPMNIVSGIPVNENGVNVAIYYFPYDSLGNIQNYYVVVKNADGVVVDEREAWPNLTATDDPTQTENSVTNELDNGQFAEVLFEPQYGRTIVTAGAVSEELYEIAPRWFLRVSSNDAATILIGRTSLEGSLNIITNPPYQLEITPEGGNITALALIQRLEHNPDIWANGYVAASLVATSLDGISHTIEGIYAPNISVASTTVFSQTTGATGYVRMEGTQAIPAGTNTDDADLGYVDFIVNLPTIGAVAITSIQVVGLESNQQNVDYDQQTVNRQESLLFSYYNPYIQAIPVPSISQGWDFKINPAQFRSAGAVPSWVGESRYLWDQTICWQSTDSLITAQRDGIRRLKVITSATGQFALVQYLSIQQMQFLFENGWSTLINAYTDNIAGASGTASFYYTTDVSLPDLNSSSFSLISTIDSNGKPATFHGNWTELPNILLGQNRFTIPYNTSNTSTPIPLNGWSSPSYGIASTATYAAIVIGFASLPATNIYFDSISVTPGRLAIPFAPLSFNETLLQLQYYYEKSYDVDVAPGTATLNNSYAINTSSALLSLGTARADLENFQLQFQNKRSISSLATTYNVINGASGQFTVNWYEGGAFMVQANFVTSSYYDAVTSGNNRIFYLSNQINAITSFGGLSVNDAVVYLHYTIDSRFGIV